MRLCAWCFWLGLVLLPAPAWSVPDAATSLTAQEQQLLGIFRSMQQMLTQFIQSATNIKAEIEKNLPQHLPQLNNELLNRWQQATPEQRAAIAQMLGLEPDQIGQNLSSMTAKPE